jgi:hypothetical protein
MLSLLLSAICPCGMGAASITRQHRVPIQPYSGTLHPKSHILFTYYQILSFDFIFGGQYWGLNSGKFGISNWTSKRAHLNWGSGEYRTRLKFTQLHALERGSYVNYTSINLTWAGSVLSGRVARLAFVRSWVQSLVPHTRTHKKERKKEWSPKVSRRNN